jgi:hypothetical protein
MLMNKSLIRVKIAAIAVSVLSTKAYAQESPVLVYIGYMRAGLFELIDSLRQLSIPAKLAILASLAFGGLLLYLRTRDTPANNLRKARGLHRKAVELHEHGKEEKAAQYYAQASQLRQKAEQK